MHHLCRDGVDQYVLGMPVPYAQDVPGKINDKIYLGLGNLILIFDAVFDRRRLLTYICFRFVMCIFFVVEFKKITLKNRPLH